jgi:hypothetical protein
VKARTGSRCQLVQAGCPHCQRCCAGRTRLPMTKRSHRAVSGVDGLAQAGRARSGGAAHLQAGEKSSTMPISPTSSGAVTCRCGQGVASTCERRAGKWQQSAARSASRCKSVRPCCTCSHKAAVAVVEVGVENFRGWSCSPGRCASSDVLGEVVRRPPAPWRLFFCFTERCPT